MITKLVGLALSSLTCVLFSFHYLFSLLGIKVNTLSVCLFLLPVILKLVDMYQAPDLVPLLPRQLYTLLLTSNYSRLILVNLWWWFVLFLAYFVFPIVLHMLLADVSVADAFGLGVGHTAEYITLFIACAAVWASITIACVYQNPAMAQYYPFYSHCSRSWVDLLIWEMFYLIQIFFAEFFYRGFVLHLCHHQFGSFAILVANIPYVFIHFDKPALEYFLSILVGLLLSGFAIKSQSIWGGVFVHCTGALVNDLAALSVKEGFPKTLFVPFTNPVLQAQHKKK